MLAYRNTIHTIPGWSPLHIELPRGMAYETDTHFVHVFGTNIHLWQLSPGLTATEGKNGTLEDWVRRRFGATDIAATALEAGQVRANVWRPGVYDHGDVESALGYQAPRIRSNQQALLLLVSRLEEIFTVVEPDQSAGTVYGHKMRELLILAATEVENHWAAVLKDAGYNRKRLTTNDYVKLLQPLGLAEYVVSLPQYPMIGDIRPFFGWRQADPTSSLQWYDAYNRTKHNREANFSEATLRNCLCAVAANLVLFVARFGPYALFSSLTTLSASVNHLFQIRLEQPDQRSFYCPRIAPAADFRTDLMCFDGRRHQVTWSRLPLAI